MPPPDDLAAAAGLTQNADGTWGIPTTPVAPTPPTVPGVGPTREVGAGASTNFSPAELAALQAQVAQQQGASGGGPAVLTAGGAVPVTLPANLPPVELPPLPGAAPPAPIEVSGAKPAAAAPPDLATAAGLTQLPDGTWTHPELVPQPGQQPPAAPPPSAEKQEVQKQPWFQDMYKNVQQGANTAGLEEEMLHGASFGLSDLLVPVVPAAIHSLTTGMPFSQAYDLAQQTMQAPRKELEAEHPDASMVVSTASGIPATKALAPLFAVAKAGAPAVQRILIGMKNLLTGSGLGGASSYLMSDGTQEQKVQAAEHGATLGGVLTGAGQVLGAAVSTVGKYINTALHPTANVDTIAGRVLLQRAGGTAPTMEAPAIPGMPLDVGQASNNPGLAAQAREANQVEPIGANQIRAEQNKAVVEHATTPQPGGTQLATRMEPSDASANVVSGMQKASDVLRAEERRRWSVDPLAKMRPDLQDVKDRVSKALGRLPLRVQRAIENNADLKGTLDDLQNMAGGASLADVNDIRSDLLTAARTLPRTEGLARRAANIAAKEMLDALKDNPEMKADPRAWAAYKAARGYTARMWDVMGHDEFQSMLKTNRYGNQAGDAGTLAQRLFNLSAGTEVTPGGIAGIGKMLDQVQRQWSALRAGGVGGSLDPVAATAAREELTNGARDFIINKMLDSALSNTRDVTGSQNTLMARLSDWIDTNKGWISRSKLFNQDQLDMLDNIRKAAIQSARTEDLKGGPGSPTFALLKGDRFVDAFIGPFLGRATTTIGGVGLGAALTAAFGEAGIGGMIGAELVGAGMGGAAGHTGQTILQRLYAQPREAILARLQEATRDPQIAHDLMMTATAANAKRMSPTTIQWLKAALATEAPGQTMARFGPGAPSP